MSSVSAPSDLQRLYKVGRYHGAAFLIAITAWGAADAWAATSDLALASVIAVANAVVAGYVISVLFHEWGHFAGARMAGSYSPMVREPAGAFIFGFSFEKNSREQFLKMSLGGIGANWLLVLLIIALVPLDTASRAALFAVALAQAISVTVFEGPIVVRATYGTEPEASLNEGLNNGSRDRGRVWGIGTGVLVWLLLI